MNVQGFLHLLTSASHVIMLPHQVSAEELDPDAYRTASDLRAKLHEASRARSALDAAARTLTKSQRLEEAEALEKVGKVADIAWPARQLLPMGGHTISSCSRAHADFFCPAQPRACLS